MWVYRKTSPSALQSVVSPERVIHGIHCVLSLHTVSAFCRSQIRTVHTALLRSLHTALHSLRPALMHYWALHRHKSNDRCKSLLTSKLWITSLSIRMPESLSGLFISLDAFLSRNRSRRSPPLIKLTPQRKKLAGHMSSVMVMVPHQAPMRNQAETDDIERSLRPSVDLTPQTLPGETSPARRTGLRQVFPRRTRFWRYQTFRH